MKIGDLAKRAGVNIQTIRFYEREKVLRKPARTTSGYRSYTDHDLQHLIFVKQCQHLGFALKEIRQLAPFHESLVTSSAADPKPLQNILQIADERLRMIDDKIRGLQEMRKNLVQLVGGVRVFVAGECPGRKLRS
jgi:DNA-binding transcriptional MerR regulator